MKTSLHPASLASSTEEVHHTFQFLRDICHTIFGCSHHYIVFDTAVLKSRHAGMYRLSRGISSQLCLQTQVMWYCSTLRTPCQIGLLTSNRRNSASLWAILC